MVEYAVREKEEREGVEFGEIAIEVVGRQCVPSERRIEGEERFVCA